MGEVCLTIFKVNNIIMSTYFSDKSMTTFTTYDLILTIPNAME